MKDKFLTIQTVFNILGYLILVQGIILIIPFICALIFKENYMFIPFIIAIITNIFFGILFKTIFKQGRILFIHSLLICGIAWIVLSLFGSIPFLWLDSMSFINSYFETVSGFTTTGITMFLNVEILPHSILLWRSLMQWIGGVGILTLFLAITYKSNNAYFQLFTAETHKIDAGRPTPSIFGTVIILWSIYLLFSVALIFILNLLGLEAFDSICYGLTTVSTGGLSNHNASIQYFHNAGYIHSTLIEYTIIIFMFIGGVNFLVHYKIFKAQIRDVINNIEFRSYILLIIISTTLILIALFKRNTEFSIEEKFRYSIFTVVSMISSSGFTLQPISSNFFPAIAKEIFLVLMAIGGCVGSTSGGIKVFRVILLFKLFLREIVSLRLPRKALSEVVIDKKIFPVSEIKKITGFVFGWIFLLICGSLITSFFMDITPFQAFSGMFSVMGNVGPSYINQEQIVNLPNIVKFVYILGMLAGRLEILPIMLIFTRKAWIY